MQFKHNNAGVCSHCVTFDLEDGKVSQIQFTGGCAGNLCAISKLCEGMDAQKLVDTLKGNRCGMKPTSCADQLAQGVEQAVEYMKNSK